jgi:tetratricopeptide (TPR) repeat protein
VAFVAAPIVASQAPVSPASTFEQLFDEYRRGDADAAVAAFARWTPNRVAAEATLAPGVSDLQTLAAFALFHTEAGMRNGRFGRVAPEVFEIHARTAFHLVARLLEQERRAETGLDILAFEKNWRMLAIAHCMRARLSDCKKELLDRGEHEVRADDDPQYLLLIGAQAEPRRVARPGDKRRQIPNFYHGAGQESRWAFTRALRLDPKLVEARMRLGRVYWVTNERVRAERELTRALGDARAASLPFETHLSALFLGELYEEQRRMAEAIEHFRMAVALFPAAHTSALALGQALVRTGQGDEGWAVGRQMFGAEAQGVPPASDPYVLYTSAQAWQNASRLASLRAAIRE